MPTYNPITTNTPATEEAVAMYTLEALRAYIKECGEKPAGSKKAALVKQARMLLALQKQDEADAANAEAAQHRKDVEAEAGPNTWATHMLKAMHRRLSSLYQDAREDVGKFIYGVNNHTITYAVTYQHTAMVAEHLAAHIKPLCGTLAAELSDGNRNHTIATLYQYLCVLYKHHTAALLYQDDFLPRSTSTATNMNEACAHKALQEFHAILSGLLDAIDRDVKTEFPDEVAVASGEWPLPHCGAFTRCRLPYYPALQEAEDVI